MGLFSKLSNKLSVPSFNLLTSPTKKGGIWFSSVGYTNPQLGLVAHNLIPKNENIVNSALSSSHKNINNIPTFNIKNQYTLRDELLKINPIRNKQYWGFQDVLPQNENFAVRYENIFKPSADILTNINNYRFIYTTEIPVIEGYVEGDKDKKPKPHGPKIKVAPALFNPLFMVQYLGITPNTPLLNTSKTNNGAYGGIVDVSNCTIKELVSQSYKPNSILGLATYRYVDFMYCKDLGKIANNHLITLRKFAYPIGDNIFEYYDESAGDVGRLVTWFGTEENKLEDILNFQYNASWKELQAKIQEIDSKEDASNRGPVGMIVNSLNPAYNKTQAAGYAGHQNIFGFFGINSGYGSDNTEVLRNYDNNKVYTPKNTIQDTVTYEGKLTFTNEFTLTFCYKLRAYDNINPRSAFLDLIGNILNVTYRRGKFWGGDRKWIGPPQNVSGWKKANAMIDSCVDKASGVLTGLASGSLKLGDILGAISGAIQNLGKAAMDTINKLKEGGLQGAMGKLGEYLEQTGLKGAAVGELKNKLGRPALYAMDSLLKGDNVGLWHLTVGNPKNPIIVMGNLILTNATIQHSGPLGLDDFPTELKVTCTLKHARSRDAVEIGRMYTKGTNGIYYSTLGKDISQWYPNYISSQGQDAHKADINNEENRITQQNAIKNLTDENGSSHLIKSTYAAQIHHTNQLLPYDLSIVLDELA